jgi:hypothetical protein
MGKLRYLLTTLSALALGTGVGSYAHHSQAAVTVSDIERDCERALRENTIEAMEAFFLKYPPSEYKGEDIACYARALNAYKPFGPVDARDEVSRNVPSGGYGN